MFSFRKPIALPNAFEALPGRPDPIATAETHFVTGNPLKPPFPEGIETTLFGMGCFWGAERKFWQLGEGIFVTAAGYAGGLTPNPTYEEVCSGLTGHVEVVRKFLFATLLKTFWENHDPTQGMGQGNDIGTQYRSVIYAGTPAQREAAEASKAAFAKGLSSRGYGPITTEISDRPQFYYAEGYHQQDLAKNPRVTAASAALVSPALSVLQRSEFQVKGYLRARPVQLLHSAPTHSFNQIFT